MRQRPMQANNVWISDFVSAATHDGRSLHLFTPLDETNMHIASVLNLT